MYIYMHVCTYIHLYTYILFTACNNSVSGSSKSASRESVWGPIRLNALGKTLIYIVLL